MCGDAILDSMYNYCFKIRFNPLNKVRAITLPCTNMFYEVFHGG